ncbi:uncharacterized protein LOC119657996 isoform X1 [Hermetia illucens]|uniref:uncharacterized protein LOC119657996 isoform X1 n=1 Tax=Hermetia illucens TaxID=343691 RepID=UPI0018CBFB78|nr:uncharacterized protein LOC119657996 isoform X1 [Hermetia illucens]
MDSFQTTITSLAVVALLLLMVVFACHYLGPRATAWVRSNREEKIGLSKSKLFNANGYMPVNFQIHSGSDFLLSSSGSFKRFDSIDRDYKQVGQSSLTLPAWNLPQNDIPPQPLRPAPAPAPSQISTKPKTPPQDTKPPNKQRSLDSVEHLASTVIPRPVAKRQLSSPAKSPNGAKEQLPINLSETVSKIQNGYKTSSTNPFLNGTLRSLHELPDNQKNSGHTEKRELELLHKSNIKNPFTVDCVQKAKECSNANIFTQPAPKTDVDSKLFFDFEPAKITSLLDRSSLTEPPRETINSVSSSPHGTIIEECEEKQTSPDSLFTETQKQPEPPSKDTFNDIEKLLKTNFRNRSFSETEVTDGDLHKIFSRNGEFIKTPSGLSCTNPFLDKSTMHKTFSEDHLTKNGNQTWSFGRSLLRQESSISLGRHNTSQTSLDSERGSMDSINLQRAISCDSVSSESSVVLADLEQVAPAVTGMLCVGLQYDKNTSTEEGVELIVTVMEAKELIGPLNVEYFDTFVRIYLVPDEATAMQTKIFKNSSSPSYNETFCFWINKKRSRRSLWFHLYHSGNAHTLIGEAELQIGDVTRPLTTWLPLSDSRQSSNNWGELMFSLSYLPTAERLTVVVVKGRNLKLDQDGREAIDLQNIFVKVYLLKNDKKVSKKKTSLKRADRCPIFNESMIFSIPPYVLNSIQLRLTAVCVSDTEMFPIGHVIVGGNTSGKGLRHWHQMLSSLRKPVAMWHALRQTNHRKNDRM